MNRRSAMAAGVLLAAMTFGGAAGADEKSSCTDAASAGQTLRDSHKLVEAREQFRVCAQRDCPAVVQRDCSGWLADIEANVPTVVVTAKDAAGADLFDVKVSVDGQPLATRLDGSALAVNPGSHAFHFELADGTTADAQVLVRQGEKNQSIAATLKATGAVAPLPAQPVPPPADTTTPPAQGHGVPLRTVGYIVGGAGIIGLAVGAIFGLQAISKKGDANCDGANLCDAAPLSDAKSAATASTVGFVVGGVLLAGGVALVLVGGHASAESHAAAGAQLRAAPMVGANGGGLMLGGNW